MTAIDINELVMFNANPVPSVMSVLKTIPSDSPQLTMQNETRAVRKYIDTVRCMFTATKRRENRKPEAISKGISRIRYTKKKVSTEYALSAYSYLGGSANGRDVECCSTLPCKRRLVPTGIDRRFATGPQNTLALK